MKSLRREAGLTLIELMIALVLGSILSAAIIHIFLGMRASYMLQTELSNLQDDGNLVLSVLSNDFGAAGYSSAYLIDGFVESFTSDGGPTGTDSVGIIYLSDRDCAGRPTNTYSDGNRYAKNRYFLSSGSLFCESLTESNGVLGRYELVSGVDDFQLLYGIDGDLSREPKSATAYVTASAISDWRRVVSARFGVLIRSERALRTSESSDLFSVLDQRSPASYADKYIRRVFSGTALLRNHIKE